MMVLLFVSGVYILVIVCDVIWVICDVLILLLLLLIKINWLIWIVCV